MSINIEEMIINETQYEPTIIDEKSYHISASMIGKDPLQNFLTIVHGRTNRTRFDDATFGTVFHKGLEAIFKDKDYMETEHSMIRRLNDDWVITGTADLMIYNENDSNCREIHDFKTAKNYTVKMFEKEASSHQYTKQLNTLAWIWSDDPVDLYVDFFIKDAQMIKAEPVFKQVKVPYYNIKEELEQVTSELQEHIENGTIPEKCQDTWIRKTKDKVIPMKCEFYCDHGKNGVCPYYKQSVHKSANKIASLDW